MKKKLLSIITVTILSITMVSDVFAAVIVTTSPYSGDYLLSINTSTDSTTSQYSGNMLVDTASASSPQFSMDTTSASPSNTNATDTKEENGLKMEQIDPSELLESMHSSNNTVQNKDNFLAYSDVVTVTYSVGAQRTFSTPDFRYNPIPTISKTFTLKYSGTKCNVWLENGSLVSLSDTNINSLGSEFDGNIYNNMTSNFGTGYDKDADGKTAILLYDIQDGWDGNTAPGFIGGFFSSGELNGYDNNMDVIHVDTYPLMGVNKSYPSITSAKSVIAHEYQHFINYSHSKLNNLITMPTWLNEGLSMAAEHMLYGALSSRIGTYNSSIYIRDGQSLFDWATGDTMSKYALSYLFVQYLRTQSGGSNAIYKSIIQSSNRTATVVQDVMRSFFSTITLDDIQKNFRMATVLLEPNGAQGFMGDNAFANVSPLLYTGSGTNLKGGGAVIKAISSPVTPTGYGSNIKFVGFKWNKVATPTSNVTSGVVLSGTQVTLTCVTSGATIRYTTDGTIPTATTGTVYSSPITLTSNTTIKAIAYRSKMKDSDLITLMFKILVDGTWKKNFSGSSYDNYNSVTTANDGYVAVGYSSSFGSGDWTGVTGKGLYDAIIVKYNMSGNVVWKKNFGGSGYDYYDSVVSVNDGYIAVGHSDSFGSGDWTGVTGKGYYDAIIVKYDTSGNVVWKKNFGGSLADGYNSITCANDGYIAVGYSVSFGNGDWEGVTGKGYYDAIIVKYDASGNVLWQKNFGGSGSDYYNSVTSVNDGYVVIGYSDSFGNGDWIGVTGKGWSDAIIVKYDTVGNLVWKKHFGGPYDDKYNSITAIDDGYIVVGYSDSSSFGTNDWMGTTGRGDYDAIIVKYNASGNVVWKKNFGGSSYDCYKSVITTNDGYIAVGSSGSSSFGNGNWAGVTGKGYYDAIAVKYDASGNVTWTKNLGGADSDNYTSVTLANDGYVAVGYSDSSSFGNGDWIGVNTYDYSYDDAIIVKYRDQSTTLIKPLFNNAYGIYNGATQLNLFPQIAGTYTIKAQYTNTTGKSINSSFLVLVKNNNKLLKMYTIPSQNINIEGVVDISQNIELPSVTLAPNLEVEIMAFDSLLSIKPLSNSIGFGR